MLRNASYDRKSMLRSYAASLHEHFKAWQRTAEEVREGREETCANA
jgi:hypothetical protein